MQIIVLVQNYNDCIHMFNKVCVLLGNLARSMSMWMINSRILNIFLVMLAPIDCRGLVGKCSYDKL